MSADRCPVCGEARRRKNVWSNKVGRLVCTPVEDGFVGPCIHSERLAIERAAEIERLRAVLKRIADQGPHYGTDGTYKSWKHWRNIAREALETKLNKGD